MVSIATVKKAAIAQGIMEGRLNRPEALNALIPELPGNIKTSFQQLNQDRKIRAVVLTGEGKSFCSGADFKQESKLKNVLVIECVSQLGFV